MNEDEVQVASDYFTTTDAFSHTFTLIEGFVAENNHAFINFTITSSYYITSNTCIILSRINDIKLRRLTRVL